MRVNIPIVFLVASLCIIVLDAYSSSDNAERKYKSTFIDTATVRFLSDFELYKPLHHPLRDTILPIIHGHEKKIIMYINVSCSSCLVKLAEWAKLSTEFAKSNVVVIMVLYSKDNFQYFKYLCEQGSIPGFNLPFILDIKNEFVQYNRHSEELISGIPCLVNEKNDIILSGDPLHSEKTRNLFMNAIKGRK
jgi:hypothetical protein